MRVIASADRSDAVRDLLVAEPGATHVTVLRGAAMQPPCDVVDAAVAREALDDSVTLGQGRCVPAMQSALQPAINLVGIVRAAAVVPLLARSRPERGRRKPSAG